MQFNITKEDIVHYVFYPILAIVLAMIVGATLIIFLFFLIYPPVGGLKRAVEKMEAVESVVSLSQPYDTRKVANMTILLKNGLLIDCYDIEFLAPPPYYAKKLLFMFAEINGYTAYRCSYNTNNTIRNIYNVEEYNFRREPVYLDDLLDVVLSLEESVGGSQFFITDESFLGNTCEEMYHLLPSSSWDYSEDGVFYKFFFVRE